MLFNRIILSISMKYLSVVLCLLLINCSNKKQSYDIIGENDTVFAPVLKRELNKLLDKKKHLNNDFNSFCSVVLTQSNLYNSETKECVVILALTLGIDSSKITGYSLVGKEPIACYILSDSCSQTLINDELLFADNEGFKQYFNLGKEKKDGNYDLPSYVYKVINADSLALIGKREYHE